MSRKLKEPCFFWLYYNKSNDIKSIYSCKFARAKFHDCYDDQWKTCSYGKKSLMYNGYRVRKKEVER